MSFSRTSHRISRRAFTLTELIVSTAVASVVGLMVMSVVISTMRLSSQNVVTNISNHRARQTLDHLSQIVRFAHDTPTLIKADGTAATAATADGLLVKNSLRGPYVFKASSGQADAEIPSGATSFVVEYPRGTLGAPEVGDFFALSLATAPELEVTAVTILSTGSISKARITTRQGITEPAKPGSYTVSAHRFRKEAYVFVKNGTYWDLRHYPRVIATTNFGNAASYKVLGSGFEKLKSNTTTELPWFARTAGTSTDGTEGTEAYWLRALARSSSQTHFAGSSTGKNTLTSMPVQIKLWNYNAPPPPPED